MKRGMRSRPNRTRQRRRTCTVPRSRNGARFRLRLGKSRWKRHSSGRSSRRRRPRRRARCRRCRRRTRRRTRRTLRKSISWKTNRSPLLEEPRHRFISRLSRTLRTRDPGRRIRKLRRRRTERALTSQRRPRGLTYRSDLRDRGRARLPTLPFMPDNPRRRRRRKSKGFPPSGRNAWASASRKTYPLRRRHPRGRNRGSPCPRRPPVTTKESEQGTAVRRNGRKP